MSNTLAIATVTATLRNLLLARIPELDTELSDLEVTTQPLDLARKGVAKAQLNLYLYQTVINSAWRTMDMPRQLRPGERAMPALALNLHYLITAYGRGETDNDAISHRVFGGAMSVLHDHPLLGASELGSALADNDLGTQFERIKITPLPLPLEEMSKLWAAFQTQYRLSTAYEVTVLLIDSHQPVKSALPVLKRGETDRGVMTATGRLPNLREIRLPRSQSAVRSGEDIVIVAEQLSLADATFRLTPVRDASAIELTPTSTGKAGEAAVHLPSQSEDATAWAACAPGFYTVALLVKKPDLPTLASNELALALAPRITVLPLATPAGTVDLTLTCEPRLLPDQRVLLLLGDRQFEAKPTDISSPLDASKPSIVKFNVPQLAAGRYLVRLRVDGVDSIPVVYSDSPPVPSFDPAQQVTVL